MTRVKKIILALAIIAIDLVSKYFVISRSDIRIVENRDLPFGISLGSGFFNLAAVVVALLIFVIVYPKNRRGAGFIMIISGALSNLIDRLGGSVTDFINIEVSTLNLADFAIIGGIAILLVQNLKRKS